MARNIPQSRFFDGFDLEKTEVNGEEVYLAKDGFYYRIDMKNTPGCIAVEYADDLHMAEQNMYDDLDLYDIPDDMTDDEIVSMVRGGVQEYLPHKE